MGDQPLPTEVIEEAVRLSRLAHRAASDATDRTEEADQYRRHRDELLADYGYTARIRTDDEDPIVVMYPDEWLSEGTIDTDAIDDTDAAVERSLTGGGEQDYDTAVTQNQAVVEQVADEHGDPHTANAAAFAAFMNNHRARPIATATAADIDEFLTDYYPRNSWPTDAQRHTIVRSLRYALVAASTD